MAHDSTKYLKGCSRYLIWFLLQSKVDEIEYNPPSWFDVTFIIQHYHVHTRENILLDFFILNCNIQIYCFKRFQKLSLELKRVKFFLLEELNAQLFQLINSVYCNLIRRSCTYLTKVIPHQVPHLCPYYLNPIHIIVTHLNKLL